MDWTIGSALKTGFAIWKRQWVFFTLLTLFSLFLPVIPSAMQGFTSEEARFVQLILGLISFVLQILASMGLYTVALKAAKGEECSFSDFFSKFHLFSSFVTAYALALLATFLGLLLLIVPGVVIALKFSLAPFVVLDQECGGVEALKRSTMATYGSKWRLLGFFLLSGLINCLGFLFLGIGFLFTYPLIVFAWSHIYYTLKGAV